MRSSPGFKRACGCASNFEIGRGAVERLADELLIAECRIEIEGSEDVVGCWDALRIEQLVVNLLDNAIKYAAGTPLRISVGSAEGKAKLVVRDGGRGVAKHDHERIFERFERAARPEEISGLGLGLHIVRQVAEAHGASACVESELGEGAAFIVELPLAPATESRA